MYSYTEAIIINKKNIRDILKNWQRKTAHKYTSMQLAPEIN